MRAHAGRWWSAGALSLWIAAAACGLEAQSVTFSAADGLRIHAAYYAPPAAERDPAPVVILLHGYQETRAVWEPLLVPLHDAGFAILALDLRGHGDSGTTATREAVREGENAVFQAMQHDLRGAYDWLAASKRHDRSRLALAGCGLGVSVALQYAATDRSVDAVVGLSPKLASHGFDPAGDIAQVTGRRVLLYGIEDDRDALYTLKSRSSAAEVRTLREATGGGANLLNGEEGLAATVARELRSAVGEPAREPVYGSINSNIYHQADSGWLTRIAASNLRHYSSAEEAEKRGLRAAKSAAPRDRRP